MVLQWNLKYKWSAEQADIPFQAIFFKYKRTRATKLCSRVAHAFNFEFYGYACIFNRNMCICNLCKGKAQAIIFKALESIMNALIFYAYVTVLKTYINAYISILNTTV